MLKRCSNAIVHAFESFFYSLGLTIGRYPWWTILGALVFVVLCVPGIPLFFHEEQRQDKLWVAVNAEAVEDKKAVEEYFPNRNRFNSIIATATSNVLTPTSLQALLDLDTSVKAIAKDNWYDWNSACSRLGPYCWSDNILQLWSFDKAVIDSLTQPQILETVNNAKYSPVYGQELNVSAMLGDIKRDGSGQIISAKATIMTWVIKYNFTLDNGEELDEIADDWETQFIDLANKGASGLENVYVYAFRSFGDEGGGAILGDIKFLSAGYLLVIVFIALVLGRFNRVQQRIYLSLAGVLCIALAIGASYGLCSYMGIFYGPLHNILPFLMLGIGVDDMFVIVQSWEVQKQRHVGLEIHERVAMTMKHAGVSITVTSMTDILAFGIGATTILPALRSFCIFAAVGIFIIFILQATFFVACLTIKERMVQNYTDACCCCITYTNWVPNDCSQKPIVQGFFEDVYAPALSKLPVKILIIVVTIFFASVGIWGTIKLEQDFDPAWFIPTDSYAYDFIQADDLYFPQGGYKTAVYMLDVDYYNDFDKLMKLYSSVSSDEYIAPGSTQAWFYSFNNWLSNSTDAAVTSRLDSNKFPKTELDFNSLLNAYIFIPPMSGIRFAKDMVFDEGKLQASRMTTKHIQLLGSAKEIAGMTSVRASVSLAGLPKEKCFAYTYEYLLFESDQVIQKELYRNLGLAFACVFVMTLLLIANLWTCILVAACVIFTLLDVMGVMYLWGLTIDTVTSINLIVAIGLAVDYAAHIGHTFMTVRGSRNERMRSTLADIAPAVFYGGFSTFLAFVLLAASNSYVFKTFFKVFFSVVLFGVFHGLVVLPVMLSWLGPAPYDTAEGGDDDKVDNAKNEMGLNELGERETKASTTHDVHMNASNGLINPVMDEQGPHKTSISVHL